MKAALVHYIPGLAFQHAAEGVRANGVSPGNTYFAGGVWQNDRADNPELFAPRSALNPTGRMAHARGDRLRRGDAGQPAGEPFITGTNLVVDGALTRGVQL